MDPASEIVYKVIFARTQPCKPIKTLLKQDVILEILNKVEKIFSEEPVLIDVPSGVHVVGDIHGNIDDLLRIFDQTGYPPEEKFVFLGDYEDRGKYGLEVLILLFSLKVKFPEHIFMIRGNHEILHVSENYGFHYECQTKYTSTLFYHIHQVFNKLPFVALIAKRIICVHGGISPQLQKIKTLRNMTKCADLSENSLLSDILWSDPREIDKEFVNSDRGIGYYFNSTALKNFLKANKLDLLIRSHELCNGYNFPYQDTEQCITVFSNTDYVGRKNDSSIINVSSCLNVTVTNFPYLPLDKKKEVKPVIPKWLTAELEETHSKILQELEEPNSEIDLVNSKQNTLHLSHTDIKPLVA